MSRRSLPPNCQAGLLIERICNSEQPRGCCSVSQLFAEILKAALALSESERAELVDLLADSLEPPPGPLHPAWKDEIRRRVAEYDAGKAKGIPWEEVQREAERLLEGD